MAAYPVTMYAAGRNSGSGSMSPLVQSRGLQARMHCIVAVIAILGSLVPRAAGDGAGQEFSYDKHSQDGPENWGNLQPDWALCNIGREQSPINIHTKYYNIDPDLPRLNTSYVPAHAVLFNDGHALEIDVVDGSAGSLLFEGGLYYLTRYHFHSPSEHAINGVRAPFEMHMVHLSADARRTVVVGLGFREGASSSFLAEFWDKLKNVTEVGVKVDIGTLLTEVPDLNLGPSYARYDGSLTTPPCTENITWTVAFNPQGVSNTISPEQLQAFKAILPEPSARPLQKLHGRSVRFSPMF